jgi:hypothetical protein
MTTIELRISDGLADEIEFARQRLGNQSTEIFARYLLRYSLYLLRYTGQLPSSADQDLDWLR